MAETNRIEHKRELTKDLDIEKEVIAFLNYHVGGYYNVIEVLSDPDHDDHEEMRMWAGKDWDSKRFNPDRVGFDIPYMRWKHAF